jgi:SAM-dependent methyltransferase
MARPGAFRFDWKYKVLIQFVLAHAPAGEKLNFLLQRANRRWTQERLMRLLSGEIARVTLISKRFPLKDAVVVEVGTGWQASIPLILYLFGVRQVHTYDHVPHLRLSLVKAVLDALSILMPSEKLAPLQSAGSLEEILNAAHIRYLAPADATRTDLPDRSVDLFFSQEVLEHVSEPVLDGLLRESRRILKPAGIAYHAFEPGDHYYGMGASRVNFLRYPEWAWHLFVKNKISYHNRLREKEFFAVFEKHGARVQSVMRKCEPEDVSLLRNGFKVNHRFAGMTPEELAVWYSEVIYSFD